MPSIDGLDNDKRLRRLDDDAGVVATGLEQLGQHSQTQAKTATTLELWLRA